MRAVKDLREAEGWTQNQLAFHAGLATSVVSQVENGKRDPSASTLKKLAEALGVNVSDLFRGEEAPKASAPPSDSDERRRPAQVPEVLGSYILGRMERHEAELGAADSPHFRTATSATLWLAGVEEEASFWTDWALEQAAGIMPVPRADSTVSNLVERFYDGLELMAFRIPFEGLKRGAEERISAMDDMPDEIASKRLAKATTAGGESRKRFEELRANNG